MKRSAFDAKEMSNRTNDLFRLQEGSQTLHNGVLVALRVDLKQQNRFLRSRDYRAHAHRKKKVSKSEPHVQHRIKPHGVTACRRGRWSDVGVQSKGQRATGGQPAIAALKRAAAMIIAGLFLRLRSAEGRHFPNQFLVSAFDVEVYGLESAARSTLDGAETVDERVGIHREGGADEAAASVRNRLCRDVRHLDLRDRS